MRCAPLALGVLSACTTLGPMPATTGISASPIGRPGAQAQIGAVPGFYASQSAQNEADAAPVKHLSLLLDPDRWLPVKGVIVGGRVFGESGDAPGEPYLGYRKKLGGVGVGVVAFGSTKRSTKKLASYHGVRFGGEAMADAEILELASWARVTAQGAASLTRVLFSGTYCATAMGIAVDCDESPTAMNTVITGKSVGVYPAATATIGVDIGKHEGLFDGARIALLGSVGRMPLVLSGEESGTGSYFTLGATITVGLGFGRDVNAN